MSALPDFGDFPVHDMAIAIRKAGDGLSRELEVDPNPHESGERAWFILETLVGEIGHKPKSLGLPEQGFTLMEDHVTQKITEVGRDLTCPNCSKPFVVGDLLVAREAEIDAVRAEEAEAARLAEEKASGVRRLPTGDDGDDDDDA